MAFGYTKSQYLAKIDALEGYKEQLNRHLAVLEGYRDQIYDFWNDDKAKQVYNTLNKAIRNVRVMLDRTDEALIMHRKSVDSMTGIGSIVDDTINAAINAITSLGK